MKTILVIEDEAPIRDMLRFALQLANFKLLEAETGQAGLSLIQKHHPDLLLLDWMLPDQSGLEVIKKLRAQAPTQKLPIIMLTALAQEEHKVKSLQMGADDYIVKPFSPMELMARIQAVLRRSNSGATILSTHDIVLDLTENKATIKDQLLRLTLLEFKLLAWFLKHPRQLASRETLLDQVWGDEKVVTDRSVDTYVKRLRKALGEFDLAHFIITERGLGYRFQPE
jgi:two-component system phosphate regulon response regulator PhoB